MNLGHSYLMSLNLFGRYQGPAECVEFMPESWGWSTASRESGMEERQTELAGNDQAQGTPLIVVLARGSWRRSKRPPGRVAESGVENIWAKI